MSTSTSVQRKKKLHFLLPNIQGDDLNSGRQPKLSKLGTCLAGWFSTSRTCAYSYINDMIVELYLRFEIFHFHTLDPNKLPLWPPNPNIKDFIKDRSFFLLTIQLPRGCAYKLNGGPFRGWKARLRANVHQQRITSPRGRDFQGRKNTDFLQFYHSKFAKWHWHKARLSFKLVQTF